LRSSWYFALQGRPACFNRLLQRGSSSDLPPRMAGSPRRTDAGIAAAMYARPATMVGELSRWTAAPARRGATAADRPRRRAVKHRASSGACRRRNTSRPSITAGEADSRQLEQRRVLLQTTRSSPRVDAEAAQVAILKPVRPGHDQPIYRAGRARIGYGRATVEPEDIRGLRPADPSVLPGALRIAGGRWTTGRSSARKRGPMASNRHKASMARSWQRCSSTQSLESKLACRFARRDAQIANASRRERATAGRVFVKLTLRFAVVAVAHHRRIGSSQRQLLGAELARAQGAPDTLRSWIGLKARPAGHLPRAPRRRTVAHAEQLAVLVADFDPVPTRPSVS